MSERTFYNEKQVREEHHLNKHTQEKLDLLNKWIKECDPNTLLDVGCGNGVLTNNFVVNNGALCGLDFSLSSLQELEMPAICGDITHLPIRRNHIDLVICSEVLEHLNDTQLQDAVFQLQSLNAPHIIITVPNDETLGKNSIKCKNCGLIFNVSHHFQRFDHKKLDYLFPDYRLARYKTCGRLVRSYVKPLLRIRQNLGNRWTYFSKQRYTQCPNCQTDQIALYKPNLISLFTDAFNAVVTQKKPYWLCAIFKRK
ncbi:MAG: class I SAM-dependent methyltransferase [Candidatus Marinimicrobia bacterium]|nr:class I SAM-dependent methyltransferase [Candidatus Neomarinimicrobiota bacterium]MCF7829835.1 class I SAM-dependent methyltransferase [Candidatus Neomarinimicrobiota bacterium]MCF7881732.1 class I SAM-dependent methyltransferase [Candidatus Neomarinimicrobiota bacterium]MCF8232839.1 class I SAM-dependent methyltransferase [Bacteroidales bacterium]